MSKHILLKQNPQSLFVSRSRNPKLHHQFTTTHLSLPMPHFEVFLFTLFSVFGFLVLFFLMKTDSWFLEFFGSLAIQSTCCLPWFRAEPKRGRAYDREKNHGSSALFEISFQNKKSGRAKVDCLDDNKICAAPPSSSCFYS